MPRLIQVTKILLSDDGVALHLTYLDVDTKELYKTTPSLSVETQHYMQLNCTSFPA